MTGCGDGFFFIGRVKIGLRSLAVIWSIWLAVMSGNELGEKEGERETQFLCMERNEYEIGWRKTALIYGIMKSR